MTYLALLGAAWLCVVGAVLYHYRSVLVRAWREPALRDPVLIVESDDWGPGPERDAEWLRRLAEVLTRYQDSRGRHPMMTVGVVLAVRDSRGAIATLADDRFRGVRDSLIAGAGTRVLALQLHGMEHYWPGAIMAAAERDPAVARWLRTEGTPRTESLPSHLQTRWADTSSLPSSPLPADEIRDAVDQELSAFSQVFGCRAGVVVPPTFVWDDRVEREWANGGVKFVVTPGRRYVGRDGEARLVPDKPHIHNGERSESGVIYLVRDRFFEPSFGHDARHGLAALAEKTRAGRPTLLEMHRFNFTGEGTVAERGVKQLDRLLASAVKAFPALRFLSSEELGEKLAARDADLVETRLDRRLAVWLVRLAEISRLRKLGLLTGLAAPAWLFLLIARPVQRPSSVDAPEEGLAT